MSIFEELGEVTKFFVKPAHFANMSTNMLYGFVQLQPGICVLHFHNFPVKKYVANKEKKHFCELATFLKANFKSNIFCKFGSGNGGKKKIFFISRQQSEASFQRSIKMWL